MDCPDPDCREDLLTRIGKCVKKHTLWITFIAVGLPLLGVNVGVWSEVTHLDDKYLTKKEMEEHIKDISVCKELMKRLPADMQEIREGQKENSRDIKEILRHLRDK